MGNTKSDMPANSWMADDFADSPVTNLIEDDPWSDSQSDSGREPTDSLPVGDQLPTSDVDAEDGVGATTAKDDSDQSTIRTQAEHVSDISVDYAEGEEYGRVDYDESSYGFQGDELETDLEFSLGELGEDRGFLDEPEPLAEYDSGLAETLYYTDENAEIRAMDLRLDELVSSLEGATETQRDQIYGLLSEFSSRRLSSWLTWLRDQEWTGQSLLLFLEFRELWEATPQWWEYSVWSHWLDRWWFYSNPSVLSRDAAYEVIQQRLHCQPDEIIEEDWFQDWDDLALWKYDFSSFASFVVFRAGLSASEDWMSHLSWQTEVDEGPLALRRNFNDHDSGDILDSWVGRLRVWEDDTPYRTYVDGPPLWFAVQDWYDTAEWHDHLGWAINWMNTIHPYLSPETTHTWADYQGDRSA